jgi:DNA-binding NarL/FixJ family response regulator
MVTASQKPDDAEIQEAGPIRVLIVDDHPATRAGLVALINQTPGFALSGTAHDVATAVAECMKSDPDVVLLDLRLGTEDGIDVIQQIRAVRRRAHVLVLTTFDGDEVIHRALEAGARGYVLKDCSLADIEFAMRVVARGKHHVPAEVATRMARHGSRVELTGKERAVLELLADGLRNKEIAARLAVGEATVRSHVHSIIAKFGVHDRGAAIAAAIARGFLATGTREVGQR